MKLLLFGAAALACGVGLVPESSRILVAGNFRGYLTPCGCTKPMNGGVLRMASAVRSTGGQFILVGPWVAGGGRQSELKAEAAADFALETKAAAWVVTATDIRALGRNFWDSTAARVPAAQIANGSPVELSGPRGERILAGDWDESAATEYAKKYPGRGTIVFRSNAASVRPLVVGEWSLVSPGEKGKSLSLVTLEAGRASQIRVVELSESYRDDPAAKQIMAYYLRRVEREGLLEKMPRRESTEYAGSAACLGCHQDAAKVWKGSKHAQALSTLEKENHGRDPDCVGCHVVGLDSVHGFRDRKTTPQLADVGCESCHGPAKSHAAKPAENRLPKVGEKNCVSCHTAENSPGFRYPEYWAKVKHSVDKSGIKP